MIALLLALMLMAPEAAAAPERLSKGRIACQATAGGTGWSWRIIDGRRCWYRGRRAVAKGALFWPPAYGHRAEAKPHPRPRPAFWDGVAIPPLAARSAQLVLSSEQTETTALAPPEPAIEPDDPSTRAQDEALLAAVWPDEPLPVRAVRTVRWRPQPELPKPPAAPVLPLLLLLFGLAAVTP